MSVKNILGSLALAAMLAGGVYVNHLRVQAGKYKQAQEQLSDLRASHAEYVKQRDKADADRAAASKGYKDELDSIRRELVRSPVPDVRLCTSAPTVPAAEDTAGGSGAGAHSAGMVHAGTATDSERGPDIGPALARLAERADTLAAQCRAVIHFVGGP